MVVTGSARPLPAVASLLVDGLDHPEAVTVDRSGTLYAGGEAGQIYRVDRERRQVTVVGTLGGRVLGLCPDGDGDLYCCDADAPAVVHLEPHSGRSTVRSQGTPKRPMAKPNWVLFDDAGSLYVTDSGHVDAGDGCIFRIAPDGATEMWCESTKNYPNGAALSADGRTLYVVESFTRPAIVSVAISADGSCGAREIIADLQGHVPDGIALDDQGSIYVCCYRPDRILRIDRDGHVDVVLEDPRGIILAAPTNAVFVEGALVMANLGRRHLAVADIGADGLALRYPHL